jgi:peptide-methionine (S)-S-oxide reductase
MKPRTALALLLLVISLVSLADETRTEIATFAGGCFWCMEPPFDKVEGVISTTSGYTGGNKVNPTYKQVSAGKTGHAEAIQIEFDPAKVSYDDLLAVFWKNIDPTTPNRQFCDHGSQYRSEIFYHNEAQKDAAEKSLEKLNQTKPFDDPVVTEIARAGTFYPAEEYHQDYYQKNPLRYKYYRYMCGRDQRLEKLWGEPASH